MMRITKKNAWIKHTTFVIKVIRVWKTIYNIKLMSNEYNEKIYLKEWIEWSDAWGQFDAFRTYVFVFSMDMNGRMRMEKFAIENTFDNKKKKKKEN